MHLIRVAHRLQPRRQPTWRRGWPCSGYQLAAGLRGAAHRARRPGADQPGPGRRVALAGPGRDGVARSTCCAAAEKTGRAAPAVAARLASFGFTGRRRPGRAGRRRRCPRTTWRMVSRDLDGSYPWLDPDRPVTTLHLLRAAEATGRAVGRGRARLIELGYRVDGRTRTRSSSTTSTRTTSTMASVDLDGAHPWLDIGQPVPAVHLLRAARVTGRDLHDVAARLTVFGYTVRTDFGELTGRPAHPRRPAHHQPGPGRVGPLDPAGRADPAAARAAGGPADPQAGGRDRGPAAPARLPGRGGPERGGHRQDPLQRPGLRQQRPRRHPAVARPGPAGVPVPRAGRRAQGAPADRRRSPAGWRRSATARPTWTSASPGPTPAASDRSAPKHDGHAVGFAATTQPEGRARPGGTGGQAQADVRRRRPAARSGSPAQRAAQRPQRVGLFGGLDPLDDGDQVEALDQPQDRVGERPAGPVPAVPGSWVKDLSTLTMSTGRLAT